MVVMYYVLMVLFVAMCAFMILLVLIQKGKGGGISGAFGGSGGNTAFGSKTGDMLTVVTSVTFGLFIILAASLNLVADHIGRSTQDTQTTTQLPAGGANQPATPGASQSNPFGAAPGSTPTQGH